MAMEYRFWRSGQISAIAAVMLLAGCAGQMTPPAPRPEPRPQPEVVIPAPKPPVIRTPISTSPIPSNVPRSPAQVQRSHPRYAPPPEAQSHWNNQLGVYVLDGSSLYYRERVYYRFAGNWQSSGRPQGPWEAVSPLSVPPGLRNLYR